ncbi:TetR family transcriptional regulator [Rhodococcus sp. 06-412-2C]|uniref:TetR/AcrR family transcriptional regulator n=1 Tax=unclassified Rhodococcus (in: high G+C Gram-positive bacteria) TaxID=192944 RepID=UPI000B9BFC63|nr:MULTISPECIES: TetR/AcrR family transcriptional regulator [unclassified Rhodococcus (in: high G+C Gram-positive bacteria)]OZC91938.1 TetR family transcriptional regulator [Rhodococcus sp. 06-412-2C]OZC92511.1 TetR family transcriptional regulator [Rhodococcus sp. 06-412-2B]
MARNPLRRSELADAGLRLLAAEGARGLTHRAIDEEAAVPKGTASNYFKTRADIIAGLIERIGERLAPDAEVHEPLAAQPPSPELFGAYIRDIVARLLANSDVTLALFELRLEASRRPEIREMLGSWQRSNFSADVEFNLAAGLPGGRKEVALFHYAIDGLLLDRLTYPIDPDTSTDEVVDALVAGLLHP